MASLQSCGHGLHLVRSSSLDRGNLCLLDDSLHLPKLGKSSQLYAGRLRDEHERFCLIFHILAVVFASHLVSRSQDSPPLHRQGLLCSNCRYCILHLGYCQGKWKLCEGKIYEKNFLTLTGPWHWPNRSPAGYSPRKQTRLGYSQGSHVVNRKFCDPHCE